MRTDALPSMFGPWPLALALAALVASAASQQEPGEHAALLQTSVLEHEARGLSPACLRLLPVEQWLWLEGLWLSTSRSTAADWLQVGIPIAPPAWLDLTQTGGTGSSRTASIAKPLVYILLAGFCGIVLAALVRLLAMLLSGKPENRDITIGNRPELQAWRQGIVSWLSVSWGNAWVARWGNVAEPETTKIYAEELGELGDPSDTSRLQVEEFEQIWQEEVKAKGHEKARLFYVMSRFNSIPKIVKLGVVCAASEVITYLGPPLAVHWALHTAAQHYEVLLATGQRPDARTMLWPTLLAILLFAGLPLVATSLSSATILVAARMNIQLRGGLSAAVFRKAQRLNSNFLADASAKDKANEAGEGPTKHNLVQITNNDVSNALCRIQMCIILAVVQVPILLALLALLCAKIRVATLHTLAVAVVACLAVRFTASRAVIYLTECQKFTGKRLSVLQEVLSNMRLMKCFAWEPMMEERIDSSRREELRQLSWYMYWMGLVAWLLLSTGRLLVIAALAGYTFVYGALDAADYFVIIQLLNSVKGSLTKLSTAVPALLLVGPSMARVRGFLALEEQSAPSTGPKRGPALDGPALRVRGSFAWQPGAEPVLRDLDLEVHPGELLAVVGRVGAGKTALLHAILGELAPVGEAEVEAPPAMAYSAQEAVIMDASLKENVLFFQDLDERRYIEAIAAASLQADLMVLPGGDSAPIGTKGVTLSGGQCQRVSLARVAYSSSTDVALLDDPFASVDGQTAAHLMQQLLLGGLMAGRVRVVVCQPDAERLRHFDRVLVLEEGRVVAVGPPAEVAGAACFQALLARGAAPCADGVPQGSTAAPYIAAASAPRPRLEEVQGRAGWATLLYFGGLGCWGNLVACSVALLLNVICYFLGDLVIGQWSDASFNPSAPPASHFLNRFFTWFLVGTLFLAVMWVAGVKFTLLMSSGCHSAMMRSLMQAPIDKFYDRTPVGQIMNRLSTDLWFLDIKVFPGMQACAGYVSMIVVVMVVVLAVLPLYLVLIFCAVYCILAVVIKKYWNTTVPMRYLVKTTTSRVSAHLVDCGHINVAARSFQVSRLVANQYMEALDDQLKADMAGQALRQWMNSRVQVIFGFLTTGVGLFGLWMPDEISVGTFSVFLVNMMYIRAIMQAFLDEATNMQFNFVSLNRLHEYTELPQERPRVLPADARCLSLTLALAGGTIAGLEAAADAAGLLEVRNKLGQPLLRQVPGRHALVPAEGRFWHELAQACGDLDLRHRLVAVNGVSRDVGLMAEELCSGRDLSLRIQSSWLADGASVCIQDLTAGYADMPKDVLRGVNLAFEAGTRLGVVGTTGCGKSTLLLCLLRILEPRSGRVEISGVNIGDLGLEVLRRTVGLVPQEPTLFSGPLRENLDPFGEHTDGQLWEALRRVRLEEAVKKFGAGLGHEILADGMNLSFGQRQLICIARMILRQPPLLLLDEATSSIDPLTQEMVHEAIHSDLSDSTVVAIAHRLETILNFDLIVVMDQGHVVEKGTVEELSSCKGSIFATMRSGKSP